jgi:hypothetical protein
VFRDLVAQYEGGESGDGAARETSSAASSVDEKSGPEGPA